MKKLILVFLVGVVISSCARMKVANVDYDDCQQRGVIDGKKQATCPVSKVLK